MADTITESLALRSTITSQGRLELAIAHIAVPAPTGDQVVVRVEAAPVNPSDMGMLVASADLSTAVTSSGDGDLKLFASVPNAHAFAGRLDQAMPVGNEGAGTVVAGGPGAEFLIGTKVAMFGGAMYAQNRVIDVADCILLPDDVSAADGAAMFINPLTALAMIETMHRERHTALVHTAAASNLGQMLVKLCATERIALVNIVRSEAQAELLRAIGAEHVVDSSEPDFPERLTDALAATGATLAFDAVGGGPLANTILRAMEAAAARSAQPYSRYGSATHKQVYTYGNLDPGPTMIDRSYGMAWGVGGFLLMSALASFGAEHVASMRARVVRDLATIFASNYTRVIGLADLTDPDTLRAVVRKSTGEKFLINPQL